MISQSSDTEAKIKAILAQVNTLKPLPANLTRSLKLMEEPEISVKEVAAVISLDQALVARILKLANSAYYGFIHPASTLQEAIARLGFRRTKTVLFTVSYSSSMGRGVKGYNLGQGILWQHSVAVAMIAQRLATKVGYTSPDEAYIAGLLHDIGKLVLEQHFQIDWNRLLALGEMQSLMLYEAELQLLGVNHAQVGGALAEKWNLPVGLVDAITHHHSPESAPTSPDLAAIIHIADLICLHMGVGLTHDSFMPKPSVLGLQLLSMGPEDIEDAAEAYTDILERIPLANRELSITSAR